MIILREIALSIDMLIVMMCVTIPDIAIFDHSGVSPERTYILMLIAMSVMIFRDALGKSIGKKILGLEIVNYKNKCRPKRIQLILRNITSFIMPLEFIFVLFRSDRRRIGDLIAGTEIIRKSELHL